MDEAKSVDAKVWWLRLSGAERLFWMERCSGWLEMVGIGRGDLQR